MSAAGCVSWMLLSSLLLGCSGATSDHSVSAESPAAEETPTDADTGAVARLAIDLLAASTTRSRRLVLEDDWRLARLERGSLLASWEPPVHIPCGTSGEQVVALEALVVLSGPFRRSVLVRAPDGIRSPFLVLDEDLWRRAEQLASR